MKPATPLEASAKRKAVVKELSSEKREKFVQIAESRTINAIRAIRVIGSSTLNVSNATFTNNRSGSQSGSGGAINGSQDAILTLSNLVVVGNFSLGAAISGGAASTNLPPKF